MTLPLVTKSDGTKFGKTASGAVWLDAHKTSPYGFYQFWLNAADADVENYLKLFTFLGQEEIAELSALTETEPQRRAAQTRLAEEVTKLVHGETALDSAQRITASLFGGDLQQLTQEDLIQLELDGMDSTRAEPGQGLLQVIADAGLARSIGDARKLVQSGGVRLNGEQVTDPRLELDFGQALHQRFFVIRRGKKAYHLVAKA